jgi:hypothetical protein
MASFQLKDGWKETQGVQRLISAKTPVSEGRMASLNPFEAKGEKAPQGTSSRVCDVHVAEGVTQAPNSLLEGQRKVTQPICGERISIYAKCIKNVAEISPSQTVTYRVDG